LQTKLNIKQHEKNTMNRIIDLDTSPFIPTGWTLISHKKGGFFDLRNQKPKLHLFYHHSKPNPIMAGWTSGGDTTRTNALSLDLINVNMHDYLMKNPECVPFDPHLNVNEQKMIVFLGTIYRDEDGNRCARAIKSFVAGIIGSFPVCCPDYQWTETKYLLDLPTKDLPESSYYTVVR